MATMMTTLTIQNKVTVGKAWKGFWSRSEAVVETDSDFFE